MQKNNKQIQYSSALGFYKHGKEIALKINQKKGNENFELISVTTVNYSFSAELFLKLLIHIVSKEEIKNEHKLEKLFEKLPNKYQSEIEQKYVIKERLKDERLNPIKLSFNTYLGDKKNYKNENKRIELNIIDLLKIHSESFIKWRYLYEIKNEDYYHLEFNFKFMDDFINSLIEVIEEAI